MSNILAKVVQEARQSENITEINSKATELRVSKLGEFIKQERVKRNMSIYEFAQGCEISEIQVKNIETGKSIKVRLLTLQKIASFLGEDVVNLEKLLNEPEDTKDFQKSVKLDELSKIMLEARAKKGWSREKLSEASKITVYTITNVERNGKNIPTLETVQLLTKALDLDIKETQKALVQRVISKKKKSNKEPVTKIGKFVRYERERLGMSKTEFAFACDLSYINIYRLENKFETPRESTLEKIAKFLQRDLEKLKNLL